MKVLLDNYNCTEKYNENEVEVEPYPRKLTCEKCGSELEYEKSDIRIGSLGCAYIDCPLCRYDNMLDDADAELTLTKNNVEFPTHFFHFSKETGAVDVCNNEEVKKYIHKAIEYFRKNKSEFNWYACTGNLFISVDRYDGDESYWVVVTNNYYDTHIPFEKEDYKTW